MRNFFKEYFSFSLSARKGLWVLIVIIIIICFLPSIFRVVLKDNCKLTDEKLISEFDKALRETDTVKNYKFIIPQKFFNPNLLTKDEWLRMGVKKKVAENICNYISKGGKFHKKNDLLKIYGFDTALFKSISPYIELEQENYEHKTFERKTYSHALYSKSLNNKYIEILELNSADTNKLKKLPGIGSVLSNRIIKYRNTLGGFYALHQLSEVYGLNNDIIRELNDKISVDSSLINKIDLNSASEKIMRSHPYIGKYKAGAILRLREFQKTAINYRDLFKNGIFTKEEAEKLKYYLK